MFRDGEEGSAALLVSPAIPTLFRAVEIDGSDHWDGLLSQNPPIRHVTSEVPAAQKPDEIWNVRINPVARPATPRSLADIADRRNELAGNISLEQEIHMLTAVNDLIATGVIDDDRYKHIELREIELGLALDVHSKIDRDRRFLERLMARGESAAEAFWHPSAD